MRKSHRSPKNFNGVAAYPHIRDLLTLVTGSHKDLARPPRFGSLLNYNLLVGVRDPMAYQPTRSTTGG